MSKLNAAGAAMMVLKVSSILKTANEAVLVAVRDDLNAQIAEWQEKRQTKGKKHAAVVPYMSVSELRDRPELHQAEGQS